MLRDHMLRDRRAAGLEAKPTANPQAQPKLEPLAVTVAVTAIVVMLSLLVVLVWAPLTDVRGWLSGNAFASDSEHAGTADPSRGVGAFGGQAEASGDVWQLQLVNAQNKMADGYLPELQSLADMQAVDKRCYPELQEMLADCRDAGSAPIICSSYRSVDKQRQILGASIAELVSQGYEFEQANAEALRSVQAPGYSEHHLGLAVDIVDGNYQVLDDGQAEQATQQWLMANSWKYGFILRYPSDKEALTGIAYEPWHYRYVGKEAAAKIYERQICLEEYLR